MPDWHKFIVIMCFSKTSIFIIFAVLSTAKSACGVTLVQTGGTFIAFNAELGTLDDAPSNGSKFDVMAPTGGSFGDYLSVESTPGTVSFDIDFLDDQEYTVYVRYRELVNTPPYISLTFGGSTTVADVFVDPSTTFVWTHVSGLNFTVSGTTPGLAQTVTISAVSVTDFDIDAIALVSTSALNGGGFTVSDATIPEGSLIVPEPSSALLFLL